MQVHRFFNPPCHSAYCEKLWMFNTPLNFSKGLSQLHSFFLFYFCSNGNNHNIVFWALLLLETICSQGLNKVIPDLLLPGGNLLLYLFLTLRKCLVFSVHNPLWLCIAFHFYFLQHSTCPGPGLLLKISVKLIMVLWHGYVWQYIVIEVRGRIWTQVAICESPEL